MGSGVGVGGAKDAGLSRAVRTDGVDSPEPEPGHGHEVGHGHGHGSKESLRDDDKPSLTSDPGAPVSRQVTVLSERSEQQAHEAQEAAPRMSSLLARPHHIPQMDDSLAQRMAAIRQTMGGEMEAPWDAKGRPLGGLGGGLGGLGGGLGMGHALGKKVLGSPGSGYERDSGDKK